MNTLTTPVQSYDLPIEQSDASRGANAALLAGKETHAESRAAWAVAKQVFPTFLPIDEAGEAEAALRRSAVLLTQATRRTFGIVSSVAGGLWGLDTEGMVFQVESTDGGSDYLTNVEYVDGRRMELEVQEVAAFFDSREAAELFLTPGPARFFA